MDVETNEDSFLNESDSTNDTSLPKNRSKKKNKKQNRNKNGQNTGQFRKRYMHGVSDCVRMYHPRISERRILSLVRSINTEPVWFKIEERAKDDPRRSKNAIIRLPSPEIAIKCHELVPGCKVIKPPDWEQKGKSNCFRMGNLKKSTDEKAIFSHLQKHGPIHPKEIHLTHRAYRKSTGYAIIECDSIEDATKCLSTLQGTELKGNRIYCLPTKGRGELKTRRVDLGGKTKCIKLLGIHYLMEDSDLEQLCAKYGTVRNVTIYRTKVGYPTGTAYVTMKTCLQARNLFLKLHGKKYKYLTIRTVFCDPEEIKDLIKNIKIQAKEGRRRLRNYQRKQMQLKKKLNSDGKQKNGKRGKKSKRNRKGKRKGGVKHA